MLLEEEGAKKVEQTGGLHLMQKVIHLIYFLQVVAGENVARQYHKIVCRMALKVRERKQEKVGKRI